MITTIANNINIILGAFFELIAEIIGILLINPEYS